MKTFAFSSAAVVALGAIGVIVWFFAVSGNEPTTDVTAPALESTTTVPEEPGSTTAETSSTTSTTQESETVLFEVADGSTATFTLDEELRGRPTTVVGVSSIVLGQVELDLGNLTESRIGEILVNARDFTTDSSNRNRAINGPILDTGVYEFVSFVPTSIDGLSGEATVGEELAFRLTGDLTIRDVTNEVSWDVNGVLADDGTLEVTASTTVLRSDFDLSIPSAPGVANVSDEVLLELEMVAEPVS
jgi:polyisoprenoid-binding protein YceI